MCFKRLPPFTLFALAMGLSLFLLSSCNLKVGESPFSPGTMEIQTRPCLHDIGPRMEMYFSGQLPKDSVEELSACMSRGLKVFLKTYETEAPDSYAPVKLRNFMHRYFLQDKYISEEFLEEIMVAKKVLFGGSTLMISRTEIQSLRELIELVGHHALVLRPYMPLLTGKVKNVDSDEHLKEGFKKLRKAADEITARLALSQQSYEFFHFTQLMESLREFFGWEKVFLDAQPVSQWMALVAKIKQNIIGEPAEKIKPKQWKPFIHSVISSLEIYLYYQYFIRGKAFYESPMLTFFDQTVQKSLSLVEQGMSNQNSKTLDMNNIFDVVRYIIDLKLLPPRVTFKNFEKSFRPGLTKIFAGAKVKPDKRTLDGLNQEHLKFLRYEYDLWFEVQKLIDQLKPYQVNHYGFLKPGQTYASEEAIHELVTVLKSYTLHKPGFSGIYVDDQVIKKKSTIQEIKHNAYIMNSLRAAVRFAIRGYSRDYLRTQYFVGITESELQDLFVDLKPVGVELTFVNPDSDTSGERAFLEANLFTFSGNGILPSHRKENHLLASGRSLYTESLVNMNEGMELLSFLLSTAHYGDEIFWGLVDKCPQSGKVLLDKFDKPLLDRTCFKNYSRPAFVSALGNLPDFRKFIGNLDYHQWMEYIDLFMRSTEEKEHWKNYISSTQIVTTTAIFHYISSIMARYDGDANLKLSFKEIDKAFKNFRGLMRKIVTLEGDDLSEKGLEHSFYFMLKYGRKPGVTEFYGWGDGDSQKVEIGFMELSRTMTMIAEIIRNGNAKKSEEILEQQLPPPDIESSPSHQYQTKPLGGA